MLVGNGLAKKASMAEERYQSGPTLVAVEKEVQFGEWLIPVNVVYAAAADGARAPATGIGYVDHTIRFAIEALLSVAGCAQAAIAVFELGTAADSDDIHAAIPVVASVEVILSLAIVGAR